MRCGSSVFPLPCGDPGNKKGPSGNGRAAVAIVRYIFGRINRCADTSTTHPGGGAGHDDDADA
jgi:hypothetical protein